MSTRRRDWTRLAALLPLLLLAAIGRSRLSVDVENLAMKAVGTPTDAASTLRDAQFGNDPTLFLLATPKAPELLAPLDERDISAWIAELQARPEVTSLVDASSPNAGEHCISVTLRTDADGRYASSVEDLSRAARATSPPTFRLAIAGIPATEVAIAHEMSAERARILPLIAAALALILLLVYRSPVLVLGALFAPLVGVFLLEGLQGLLGLGVDPVSGLLGPSILTVGVATSVHIVERFRRLRQDGVPVAGASTRAARELKLPMLLTVATTAAGFLGLLTSPIPAVRRFGVLASAGTVLVVLTTLLCLPSLLRLLHTAQPRQRRRSPRREFEHGLLLQRWARPVRLVAVLVAVGALLLSGSDADTHLVHVLSEHSLARTDSETVARQLGGSEIFELLLPPGGPAGPLAPAQLGAQACALDGIAGIAAVPRGSADGYRLLTFLLAPGGSAQREQVFGQAEALAAQAGWKSAQATGLAVRIARDSNDLVHSQRRGILVTLTALWLVMALGFRSPWLGLLGLVPNVLPLLLIQGAMGALHRPLSVASSMIAVVMLGLVVDDTIHLLHAYREATGSRPRRITQALGGVGRPIVITTLVLSLGFAAAAFGELSATREFGALAVATLLIALAADLVLLPAILLLDRPRTHRMHPKTTPCPQY